MIAPPDRRPLAGTARPTTDADGSPLPPTAIVSGAGPGGAAAALLLAAVGFGVTVLERQAVPAAVGGALLLQPNGLAVLAGLGLADDLARCRQVRSGTIRDGCGRRLLEAPVHTAGPGLDANVVIRRSQLFSLLRDRLAAHPGIDVRFGHAATAFDGEHVEVATPTGTVGWRADLVVAADGIGSALRPWIVPPELVQVVPGRTYARAIVDGPVPGGAVGEWWTDLGLFGAAELDDGAYVFAAAAHPDLVAALESGDVGAFASRWAEELPLAGELLGRVPDGGLLVHRADEVHAGRWVTERAALLGDAAHAMAPNTGQGANSALVDAAVLAMELACDRTIASSLEAYEARRRPAVTQVQSDARRLARLAAATSGPGRVGRDLALRLAGCLPAHRQARRLYQEDPAQLRDRCAALVATAPRPWSR